MGQQRIDQLMKKMAELYAEDFIKLAFPKEISRIVKILEK